MMNNLSPIQEDTSYIKSTSKAIHCPVSNIMHYCILLENFPGYSETLSAEIKDINDKKKLCGVYRIYFY